MGGRTINYKGINKKQLKSTRIPIQSHHQQNQVTEKKNPTEQTNQSDALAKNGKTHKWVSNV